MDHTLEVTREAIATGLVGEEVPAQEEGADDVVRGCR